MVHSTRFLPLASAVLLATPGCRHDPPKVTLSGPSGIVAGQAAAFTAKVTPEANGLKYSWKTAWVRDRPGRPPCEPEVSMAGGAKAEVSFPRDCGGATFDVGVAVRSDGGAAKARARIKVSKVPEPVWPDPLPTGWKVLNDYEKPGDPRANLWGGFFGTWGFNSGRCGILFGKDSPNVLKVSYALPMGDSSCGTFEYLKGARGKPQPVDIRGFDRVAFMMKSGDGKKHSLRLEVVELDPYAATLQGYVGQSRLLEAGPDWKRYEVRLDDILHPMFDRRMGKQVGLKIERKDQGQASGVVLLDNVTFVSKAKEK